MADGGAGDGGTIGPISLLALAVGGMVGGGILAPRGRRATMGPRGLVLGAGILVVLLHRLATGRLFALLLMLVVFAVALGLRPWLLRRVDTERRG